MKATADIIRMDPEHPDAGGMALAAELIRQAKVVVFPTSSLYGLGADALNPQAVDRVFALKGRAPDKPLLVLIDPIDMMDHIALPVSPMARHLMQELWPGKITFVVTANKDLPAQLTGGSGKIGVRLALHPVARALVRALGRPLTATSANLSGAGGCATVADLSPDIRASVDLVLDVGELAGGPGSTVLDVTGETPQILRHGTVAVDVIQDAFKRFIVLTTGGASIIKPNSYR